MVNRMRANRSHRGNRRSHHALDDVRLSKCSNCAAMHIRHTMCTNCGTYRGKKVVDVTSLNAKRAVKKEKALAASTR